MARLEGTQSCVRRDQRLHYPMTTCLVYYTRARGEIGGLRVKAEAEEGAEGSRYHGEGR